MKRCAFLSVGDEILRGLTTDTNAGWFARILSPLGWEFIEGQIAGDSAESIEQALSRLRDMDLILITGGLGPTEDDVTREGVASYLKKELLFSSELWDGIKERFRKTNRPVPPSNRKQADLIDGAVPLMNRNGTAPGQLYEEEGQIILLLPGPPVENRPMFLRDVLPLLRSMGQETVLSDIVSVVGGGESRVAQIAEKARLRGIKVGYYYNSQGWVEIHLHNRALTEEEFFVRKERLTGLLCSDPSLFLFSGPSLDAILLQELDKQGLTTAFAESLTGGLAGDRLVSLPGASRVFLGSIVAYDNALKERCLGVKKETLAAHGAVSEETAREMVEGLVRVTGAETALSFTGIAGPEGGTPEKPVGLTFIGTFVRGQVTVGRFQFHGTRDRIRSQAVSTGYAEMLKMMGYTYK
jgi:nicotinamide-nucleotide amidase